MTHTSPWCTRIARIVAMAGGPNGVRNADVQRLTGCNAHAAANDLLRGTALGLLHTVRSYPWPKAHKRWFASADQAQAWCAARPPLPAVPLGCGPGPLPRTPSPALAPAAYTGVPYTVCHSMDHDPRYQVPPGTQVVGLFAMAGIGRCAETGLPWGAARAAK